MKISLFYYSGAGNTKYIAKKISLKLQKFNHEVQLLKITATSILDVKTSDMYIIGFPIYDLTSPQLVKDLIANIKDTNKAISFFCTKAFASADSIKEVSELSAKKSLYTVAQLELFMPATDALIFFAKADSVTEKIIKFFYSRNIDKRVDIFISQILNDKINSVKQKWYVYLAFLIPKKTKDDFHAQYTKYIPMFYSQTDICIECMKCVKECPRDNIRFDEYIRFDLNCDMCLHCVHHCPTESIQIGDFTEGNARYKKVDLVD